MALAVVIVLLVIGSLIFHFASPWYFTPLASNWSSIDFTVNVTFWVTGIVFVAVNLFTAYAIVRYRHKEGRKAHYEPENKKLEGWLTGLTAVGVVAMLTPGLFVWGNFITVPDDAIQFEAMGKQWHWSFRMPGDDGLLGDTEIRHMSVDNPFGMDPNDPTGQDDILIANPVMHLPLDQPAHALLRSTDVLHNFAVPQFRIKMDLVPGMVTYQWFTPITTGTYEILCEELCGIAHFAMRGKVVVDEADDYQQWLNQQPTFAETMARPTGSAAAGAATYGVCTACHGAQGEGMQALNAPKIAGLGAWYIRRQIANYQDGIRASDPRDIYGIQMAPMARILADDSAVENVIAHIQTLPNNAPEPTIFGDVDRGRKLYTTCSFCHGNEGEGRWNTNAPRLASMSDWYIAVQLENFKQGIRGGHDLDVYGDQMTMMANILKADDAINDVVAYINTL